MAIPVALSSGAANAGAAGGVHTFTVTKVDCPIFPFASVAFAKTEWSPVSPFVFHLYSYGIADNVFTVIPSINISTLVTPVLSVASIWTVIVVSVLIDELFVGYSSYVNFNWNIIIPKNNKYAKT